MQKRLTIFVFFLSAFGFSPALMAQSSKTTTAAAKIGTEIALTETSALHFGTMAVPTGVVNVVLSTTNVRTASVPANITLLAQAPVHQNAAYTVYGDKNNHYTITLPANNIVTITSGPNLMHVDSFTARSASDGFGTTGKLNLSGTDTFTVGATLKLLNAQSFGVYSGTFSVTVAYD